MSTPLIPKDGFYAGYQRFLALHKAYAGHSFVSFDEGLLASWESYKPQLRQAALAKLDSDSWTWDLIGSGEILEAAIRAIELEGSGSNTNNNLVMWQNRYGHASRDHFVLLDARRDRELRLEVERLLFDLYRGDGSEAAIFERFSNLSDRRYPFVAYLFFLKDIARFTPVRQTRFAHGFRALGIDKAPLDSCSWDNYRQFLEVLEDLRSMIAQAAGLSEVALIDAHSFCWVFACLIQLEAEGRLVPGPKSAGAVHTLGPVERSVVDMCRSITHTTRQANGQLVEHRVKNKDLRMSPAQLEHHLHELLERQAHRCALSGLPLQFNMPDADTDFSPSPDRIDSDGHYEEGNIQVVCRFINFWKRATVDSDFRRLLNLVQRGEPG